MNRLSRLLLAGGTYYSVANLDKPSLCTYILSGSRPHKKT